MYKRQSETRVEGGVLSFCTERGNFTECVVPLDKRATDAAEQVAKTIDDALAKGFLPAAPGKDECNYCDFRSVCGPYEELRTRRKETESIEPLEQLRRQP